jgi:hypothetical protein
MAWHDAGELFPNQGEQSNPRAILAVIVKDDSTRMGIVES